MLQTIYLDSFAPGAVVTVRLAQQVRGEWSDWSTLHEITLADGVATFTPFTVEFGAAA